MNRYQLAACLLAPLIGTSTTAPAAEGHSGPLFFDDSKVVSVEYPSWFKASFMSLDDDLAEARDHGKMGLMLLFGTNGCAYCKAFVMQSLSDEGLQKQVRENFDVIGLDMFSDVEITDLNGQRLAVKHFALREGATVAPTIIFVGTDGRQLLRLQGYYPPRQFRVVLDYLAGRHFEIASLRDYVVEQMSPGSAMRSAETRSSMARTTALDFNRQIVPARRPLVVFFVGSDCLECQQLRSHVLTYPPVSKQIARFATAHLDWLDERTPLVTAMGRRSNPADWARELDVTRVPTMVFFDEGGREVFRLESQVLRKRMERALLFVLEEAYADGTTYQQFTRAKTIEELNAKGG
jgi:thioredoxin-related protein